jgi:DNA-binding CsgD family transcriptional regulator
MIAPEQTDGIVCPEVDPTIQADIQVVFSFARLTGRECDVVLCSFVEGLDDQDIASRLGMSAVNVRVHRFRALQKLARARRFLERLDGLPADCRAVASRRYGVTSGTLAPPTDPTECALLRRAQDLLLTHLPSDAGRPAGLASEIGPVDRDILVLIHAAGRGPREVADWLNVSPIQVRRTVDAYGKQRGG